MIDGEARNAIFKVLVINTKCAHFKTLIYMNMAIVAI